MRSKSSEVICSVVEDDGSVSEIVGLIDQRLLHMHTAAPPPLHIHTALSLSLLYACLCLTDNTQVSIISKSQRPRSIDEVRGRGRGRVSSRVGPAKEEEEAEEEMSSTGNTPLFKTVQLRQIQHFLPAPDAASICTAGSQSRVGSRRIKNANLLLPLPLNDDDVGATTAASPRVVDSNSIVVDPLKLPNSSSSRDEVSRIVFKKSMEDMKVRTVPTTHTCLHTHIYVCIHCSTDRLIDCTLTFHAHLPTYSTRDMSSTAPWHMLPTGRGS